MVTKRLGDIRLRIVISSAARNLFHLRLSGRCVEPQTGSLPSRDLRALPSSVLYGASIFLCAAPPFLISHSSEAFNRNQGAVRSKG